MPHKGRKSAGGAKAPNEQCDKKAPGASKPTDKKTPESKEKKHGTTSVGAAASASSSVSSAGDSKASSSQERTMKPTDPKAKPTPKTEPPKSAQTTQPKTATVPKATTEKGPTKQDAKKADVEKPKDYAVSSAAGKAAAATIGATAVGGAAVGAAAVGGASVGSSAVGATSVTSSSKSKEEVSSVAGKAVGAAAVGAAAVGAAAVGAAAVGSTAVGGTSIASSSKPKEEVKEEKKLLSVDKIAAASAPSKSEHDDALDLLIDSLVGPEIVPESPKFTGPEVAETPVTSEYLEELGKKDTTIPPEYRHLLDGKGEKPTEQPKKAAEEPMDDDDLVAAMSSEFVSSPAPPEEKKPKLEEKKEAQKASTSLASPSQAPSAAGMDAALDELMGTLDGPEFSAPESPAYTGPEVTESLSTETHIDELGKRETTIPPAYRHLLDGKEGGKPAPPPTEEKPLTESELADEFDKDFACAPSPTVQQTPSAKPKDAEVKKSGPEAVISASSVSSVQATPSKAPTSKVDPLDALAGTLGAREQDPKDKKPVADKVKEKTDKGKKDKLGEDEETIPPDYRLKEVKDKDGKPLLPKPEEKPQAMSEDDLLDALTEGFVTSPVASQCPPIKSAEKPSQKSTSEEILSCSKVSSVQSSVPKPSSAESGAKTQSDSDIQIPDDALDLLSGSLGMRKEDPDENKPIVDVVKERAKKEHIDRLGDRDDTIPPEYRHLLDGKDEGKPGKPEDLKPKTPLSDDAAIDALSSGFSSCDTGSADKAQTSSKDKTVQMEGKALNASKDCSDKTGKCTTSTPVSQTTEKTPNASKPTSKCSTQTPSPAPSDSKTSRH